MTTIVYRDGVMAADKYLTLGDSVVGMAQKIRKFRGGIIGGAGAWSLSSLVLSYVERKGVESIDIEEILDGQEQSDCDFLFVDKHGQVWLSHECSRLYKASGEFFAIGTGANYAMGAMAMGATAEQAVLVATRFDINTGGGIDIIKLQKLI